MRRVLGLAALVAALWVLPAPEARAQFMWGNPYGAYYGSMYTLGYGMPYGGFSAGYGYAPLYRPAIVAPGMPIYAPVAPIMAAAPPLTYRYGYPYGYTRTISSYGYPLARPYYAGPRYYAGGVWYRP